MSKNQNRTPKRRRASTKPQGDKNRNATKKSQPANLQELLRSSGLSVGDQPPTSRPRSRKSKTTPNRRRRRAVNKALGLALKGGREGETYERTAHADKVEVLDIEEVDNAKSYLMGDVGSFAMTNVTRIPVKLNKRALWEIAATIPLYAMSKRMPQTVYDVDGLKIGVFALAAYYYAQDLLDAAGGAITQIQESLVQYWEVRCAMTETERGNYAFYFDVESTPEISGPHGLWPTNFPCVLGAENLGWPTGNTIDGYDEIETVIPILSRQQLVIEGARAIEEINAYLSGLGYEISECPAPGTPYGRYYDTVGAFAMPEPSGGISCATPQNTVPAGAITEDERGSRLGVARLEVEWYEWENWLASLGLAMFDDSRTPPETKKLHLGVMGFRDRLFNDLKGRSGSFVEVWSKQKQIETVIYEVLYNFVVADVYRTLDRAKDDPWSTQGPFNRTLTQWDGSALLGLTWDEFVNAVVLSITTTIQEYAFVTSDMTFIDGSLPLGVGVSGNAGFASQQTPMLSQVVEFFRSTAPLCAVQEGACERDGVRGEMKTHMYNSIQQTAPIQPGLGLEANTDDLILRILNTAFGNVTSTNYRFAVVGAALPPFYSGPFNPQSSYVEGASVDEFILKFNAAMGALQPYTVLETTTAEKNGPPNTLLYYTSVIEVERQQVGGEANILMSDYQRLLNKFPIVADVIGWDASHLLQSVFIDPSLSGSRKISLPLIQSYYRETNSIAYEKELTVEQYLAIIGREYIQDRASFASENMQDDKDAIVQHLGGGFFRALLGIGKKIVGAIPGAVQGFASGGIPGAIAGGAAGLLGAQHGMMQGRMSPTLAQMRLNLRYHDRVMDEREKVSEDY